MGRYCFFGDYSGIFEGGIEGWSNFVWNYWIERKLNIYIGISGLF